MTYAHLPNAPHIDRVLAHAKNHPEKWDDAYSAALPVARGAALHAARGAALHAARIDAWDAAWAAAWDAARGAAWDAARGAAAALVAWDDASMFLDQDPAVLRMAAAAGNPTAILLLPAAIAMRGGA
jgi:hypothetical protein